MDFLCDPINKRELFDFLTIKVEKFNWQPEKVIYITSGQTVISVGFSIPMQNCNHEEADINIVVHVMHALEQGESLSMCIL